MIWAIENLKILSYLYYYPGMDKVLRNDVFDG